MPLESGFSPTHCCVNLLLPDIAASSYSDSDMILNLKTCLVPTQGQVVSQLVFSAPYTNSDGLDRWGKQTGRAFLLMK